MKRFYLTFLILSTIMFAGAAKLIAQEFTQLETRQMGDNISIVYSIEKEHIGQLFNVRSSYSLDGGRSFNTMNTVWGNIGNAVKGGRNQLFVWDVLEDLNGLQGDVQFKLEATPHSVEVMEEEFSKVNFKLVSLHHIGNNQAELVLEVTNEGDKRDLKIFNRLISFTGYNNRKYEAQWGNVGGVVGSQRHSAPQRTMQPGETIEAVFRFHRVPDDLERIMRLDVGSELLTITWGVDLEIGNVQFRDFPILDNHAKDMQQPSRRPFETVASARFDIEPIEIVDTIPPVVALISPEMDDFTKDSYDTEKEKIVIKGQATDDSGIAQVVVNGRSAKLQDDGNFEATVDLQSGYNEIVIRAVDTRFNSVEHKLAVNRKATPGADPFSDIQELDNMLARQRPSVYYAFIVGVDEYPDHGIVSLQNPISDAKKLANVLTTNYQFEEENVILMEDATRADIIDEFDRLARRVTDNDNLLIFFAGHGFFDLQLELGYWLLKDASISSTANWLANSQIRDYVGAIKSRHTLLIADACFSGGIFQTRIPFEEPTDQLDKVYTKPSRKAMTSGNLSEVPDESIFLKYLVKRLEENTRSYIRAEELFSSLSPMVISQTSTEPQYGDIKGTGDQGGDFVFRRRE